MDPSRFLTHTLRSLPQGETVCRILAASLEAVDPAGAVTRRMKLDGDILIAGNKRYDLRQINRIFLVGAGKAGVPMAKSVLEILGSRVHNGIVIVKEGYGLAPGEHLKGIKVIEAAHPIPDERGASATREILTMLSHTSPSDLVICLLSGGASALLTAPARGITLADLQTLTDLLLRSGATIHEVNAARKHVDTIKGGGLARSAAPAQILSLILSDVVGDQFDVIASGPTAPDASTSSDALTVVKNHRLEEKLPSSIITHFMQGIDGKIPDTPKPGDALFDRVENLLAGSNLQAAQAGIEAARNAGFNTQLLTLGMQGEARHAGRILAGIANDLARGVYTLSAPACIVAGGETTVVVRGDGKGGRNQEVALAAVGRMSGLPNVLLVALATDGGDGPTDAAGAVVSGGTLPRARANGMLPAEYLARNDAYPFFTALDDLIKIGPTLTNVNDLVFVFAF